MLIAYGRNVLIILKECALVNVVASIWLMLLLQLPLLVKLVNSTLDGDLILGHSPIELLLHVGCSISLLAQVLQLDLVLPHYVDQVLDQG